MRRSKPTQASLPASEIRDALKAAANHLSKTPMASKRLLFVAAAISRFLNSDKLTLDQAFGLKRVKRQYERPSNEKHIALVCSALEEYLNGKAFTTISELAGKSRKEFRSLSDRYLPVAIDRLTAEIKL